ncbi:hypothetical protein ACP8Y2_07145 [Herpetosiphon llansteffanensis]
MRTLINLVGTRLEIQAQLHHGNVAAARNLITNRMISPWLLSTWLTPAEQALLTDQSSPLMNHSVSAELPYQGTQLMLAIR